MITLKNDFNVIKRRVIASVVIMNDNMSLLRILSVKNLIYIPLTHKPGL